MPSKDTALPVVALRDIESDADELDVPAAAETYRRHGCLVVRGLMERHVAAIANDIDLVCRQAIALLDRAEKVTEGWRTPDGTLFIPAPQGFERDRQLMVIALNYTTSAAFFHSAFDEKLLDLIEAIVGHDVELFGQGQSLVKEPVGGHPKMMHQDSAYFEHRFEGPVGVLCYAVDTTYENGALHVVPGSHQLGQLRHGDTVSHLGLNEEEWPIERGLRIDGSAGDAILFHVRTIHGSPVNRSRSPRPVFIHRYRRPDDYVTVSASTVANRAEAEARSTEARKENQKGLMVRGFRRFAESR